MEKNLSENKRVLEDREDIIEGRNAVIEALKSGTNVENVMVSKGDTTGSIKQIFAICKEKGIIIKEVDRRKLDSMAGNSNHQGVIARVTPYTYCEVKDILDYAKSKGEEPFIVILDELNDPHNFGALIRTAEACGVHGIIISKRRCVTVTSVVYKSSAGAISNMKVAKVSNINNTIDLLKEKNIWIYGAHMEAPSFCHELDYKGAVAIVIGGEDTGITKLTKEKCDFLVKIPMVGKISSLNASVAGGIMMYEVLKNRLVRD